MTIIEMVVTVKALLSCKCNDSYCHTTYLRIAELSSQPKWLIVDSVTATVTIVAQSMFECISYFLNFHNAMHSILYIETRSI